MTSSPATASCPDRVRAYHEAGHATLNLAFGYGLAHCSIETTDDDIEGQAHRIEPVVAEGHYLRILAAGEWGEYQSGHDFEHEPCASGSGDDRLKMTPQLLNAAGYHLDEHFFAKLPFGLTPEMEDRLIQGHEWVMLAVTKDFQVTGRIELLHEIASLLMEHRTLPADVLSDLNERFPVSK